MPNSDHWSVRGSLPLGSICGIPLRLHFLFVVLLVLQVALGAFVGGWYALTSFLVMGPILLFTILVHELGHCLAARQVGGEADMILLWPLGGLAFIGHRSGAKADLWVTLAGPLTHIPLVALWLLILLPVYKSTYGSLDLSLTRMYGSTSKETMGVAVVWGAIVLNIILFAFNLLVPAYPLDGGRILVDILLARGTSHSTTAQVTLSITTVIIVGLLVYTIFFNFSLLLLMVVIFIGFENYRLFDALRKDNLALHPLFAHLPPPPPTTMMGYPTNGAPMFGAQLVHPSGAGYPVPPSYPVHGYPVVQGYPLHLSNQQI